MMHFLVDKIIRLKFYIVELAHQFTICHQTNYNMIGILIAWLLALIHYMTMLLQNTMKKQLDKSEL